MKIFFTLCMALAINANAGTKLARIELDKPNYAVGEKAIVFAYLDHHPENKNDEFDLKFNSFDSALNFIPISDNLSMAFTPKFTTPGDFDVSVDIFQRKRAESLDLNSAIAFYTLEIRDLREKLNFENDPEAKAKIQEQIVRDTHMISKLSNELEGYRSLVATNTVNLLIEPGAERVRSLLGVMTLTKDHANYTVGQKAIFIAHLSTQFNMPGGVENIFSANIIGGQNILSHKVDADDYSFTSNIFQASDIGSHAFQASFYIRSKKQADTLRQALALTNAKKVQYLKEQSESGNPSYRAYLQLKIEDLQLATTAINSQMQDALLPISSEQINFSVAN